MACSCQKKEAPCAGKKVKLTGKVPLEQMTAPKVQGAVLRVTKSYAGDPILELTIKGKVYYIANLLTTKP